MTCVVEHYLLPPEGQCGECEGRCIHGYCDCDNEVCPECFRRFQLEQEAEREANWQRDVAGPLLGFKDSEE